MSIFFALAILGFVSCTAAEDEDAVAKMITSLDRNGDKRIDRSEIAAFAAAQGLDAAAASQELSEFDADGDGMLNVLELAASTKHTTPQIQQVVPAQRPFSEFQVPIRPAAMPQTSAIGLESADVAPSLLSSGTSASKQDAVSSAAQLVVEKLRIQEQAEEQAEVFARRASELRANSTALTKAASQRALRAGASAAEQKAKALLDSLAALEKQADEADAQAAFLRRRSKSELQEADEFSKLAGSAMKP